MENHHTTCLLCGSSDLSTLKGYEHAFLVECGDCGFVFGSRIPDAKELSAHYGSYPRNNYLSPITIKRYEDLLESFERYRKTNRILDIGCGDGYFLAVAKSKGWEVFGTEFTEDAVAVCREKGITMHQGRIQEWTGAGDFDVITSFEVLEHINDTHEHLAKINSLLRKDGLFYFTTPNFDAVSRKYLKGKWRIVEYPEHLCYFTRQTIHLALTKNGFNRISVRTTGMEFRKFAESNETAKPAQNNPEKPQPGLRNAIEQRWILRFAKAVVNDLLTWLSAGDTLKGYYAKR